MQRVGNQPTRCARTVDGRPLQVRIMPLKSSQCHPNVVVLVVVAPKCTSRNDADAGAVERALAEEKDGVENAREAQQRAMV